MVFIIMIIAHFNVAELTGIIISFLVSRDLGYYTVMTRYEPGNTLYAHITITNPRNEKEFNFRSYKLSLVFNTIDNNLEILE